MASGELSLHTIKDGEYMVACFSKCLGSVRLADISPHTIESLHAVIRKDKTDAGRPVNGATMHKFRVVLKQIMQKAVDHDLILRNPCDWVKAPKKHESERRSLTLDKARACCAASTRSKPWRVRRFGEQGGAPDETG